MTVKVATVVATPAVKPATRPKSCGALAVTSPDLGSKGCGRLPRHKGDHRSTLHVVKAVKAVKATSRKVTSRKASPDTIVREIKALVGVSRGRLTAAKRREALGILSTMVDSGRLSAGAALGLVTRF